jgi:hypothetical protein
MSDYYTVLKAATSGLQSSQVEARRSIYVDARNALIKELRAVAPPPSLAEISRRRLELEQAIRKVECESVDSANPVHIAGPRGGSP